MMQRHNRRFVQWFYFADNDLLTADSLLKSKIWNQVCYHAQQAVEKAVKGYLKAGDIRFRKTHDLLELYEDMGVTGDEWKILYEGCVYMNRFYVSTRYPDAFVGSLPEGLPNESDARKALAVAEEIVAFLKSRLKI